MMHKMGFPVVWVNLVMKCISFVSYSILIKDDPYEHITPVKGLCQGDLLSPYLFLICAKGFSTLLRKAEDKGEIHGIGIY